MTIGRSPDCNLVLDDPLRLISRQHAWLVPQGADGALLRCISTSAPLSVNGEVLPPGGERLVHSGDTLRIGGFELHLEPLHPQQSAPPPPPTPKPVAAPVRTPPVAPRPAQTTRASRLDQWFDLDTVADPLGPGSPLPALDNAVLSELTRTVARRESATAAVPVRSPPASPAPSQPEPPGEAIAQPVRREDTNESANENAKAAVPERPPAEPEPAIADRDALRRAFLRGAGLDANAAETAITLSPAWMEHLGALLRTATEGTLALLRSRAVAKRSIRAEGTRIAARENNPLKFAPDTAEALALLMHIHSTRGFLDPVDALRDAHNDLQVHQLAMVAGMRAAVFELISRLGPEAIESGEGPARGLARHIPALRDAALWRRHRQRHAHLIEHLDDDFEAIFGREFLRAYEEQSRLAAAAAAHAAR